MPNQTQYLVVGEILKPWGYRGEVKVKLVTDFPKHLTKHKTVYLGPNAHEMQVERIRLHSGFALFKFLGRDTSESVEKLRGQIIQIPVEEAAPLRKGQYYHHEIVGLNVISTEGAPLGTIAEILETGANDVYLVRAPTGSEILIPAIQSVIQDINLDAHTMTVTLLPGLVD